MMTWNFVAYFTSINVRLLKNIFHVKCDFKLVLFFKVHYCEPNNENSKIVFSLRTVKKSLIWICWSYPGMFVGLSLLGCTSILPFRSNFCARHGSAADRPFRNIARARFSFLFHFASALKAVDFHSPRFILRASVAACNRHTQHTDREIP